MHLSAPSVGGAASRRQVCQRCFYKIPGRPHNRDGDAAAF
jgi:hypothetical protein